MRSLGIFALQGGEVQGARRGLHLRRQPPPLRRPVIALRTRERLPASPPTTARTVLSGLPRTPILPCYTHTTPRTYRSYITATKRRTGATTLGPALNSPPR